jgi:arylformamidase
LTSLVDMKHHLNALRRCCALSAFAGIAAVWTLIASPLAAQVRRHLDLPYAQREGVPPGLLSLDLYAPEKSSKHGHAVLVMIHGGGWRNGDKRNAGMVRSKVPHFVGSGFVYISLNYRLSRNPRVRHPDHVQDVAAALAWVHNHVARFGGDPERIFVMGHSAGAHLATLVAVNGRLLAAHGKPLSILKGAIALDTAAYDIPRYVLELGARPQVRQMFELAFGKSESMWRDASPRHHVNKVIEEVQAKGADRSASTKIPPILLFHAGKRLASATLSKELVTALRSAGVPALTIHAADKDHAGINRCIGEAGDPYTALIMRFLRAPRRVEELKIKASADSQVEDLRPGNKIQVDRRKDCQAEARDTQGRFMGSMGNKRLAGR